MSRSWSAVRAGAFVVSALVACDSPVQPFRPGGEGEPVPVNALIEDAITGGVDRTYSFDVAVGGEYVVFLKSLKGFVAFGITQPPSPYTVGSVLSNPGPRPLEENPSNNIPTPQGGVLVIRAHAVDPDSARFQFKIYPVNTAPEIAPRRFNFGDTIVGEAIEPLVDTDIFTAHGTAGQTVAAALQPLGSDSGGVTLYVETEAGEPLSLVPAAAEPLMSTGPIPLSTSQDYRFVIRSTRVDAHPRHRGLYRVWSYVLDPAPEHVASALPVNVEVRTESIDYPNDFDDFTFQDTVGAEFIAFVEAERPFFTFVSSPTGSVAGAVDQDADATLLHHGTQPFQLTTTAPYTIRVKGGNAGQWLMADTGAYRLLLFRIDRRPESVASTVQVGDTVSGEEIYPAGDIDEFTVTATPGGQLVAGFRLTANALPLGNSMTFEVVDGATGALLSQSYASLASGFIKGTPFTVPSSGSLKVRIGRLTASFAPRAPYEFFLQ